MPPYGSTTRPPQRTRNRTAAGSPSGWRANSSWAAPGGREGVPDLPVRIEGARDEAGAPGRVHEDLVEGLQVVAAALGDHRSGAARLVDVLAPLGAQVAEELRLRPGQRHLPGPLRLDVVAAPPAGSGQQVGGAGSQPPAAARWSRGSASAARRAPEAQPRTPPGWPRPSAWRSGRAAHSQRRTAPARSCGSAPARRSARSRRRRRRARRTSRWPP